MSLTQKPEKALLGLRINVRSMARTSCDHAPEPSMNYFVEVAPCNRQ